MNRRRFDMPGILAIEPRAMGMFFALPPEPPTIEMRGTVAVLSVRDPLVHHRDPFFDSYDEIKARVATALASAPSAIVLAIDSPGGLVSGCFDTASEIEAACAAANVPVYSYVDGAACSAAYRLACIGREIVIPAQGIVGSIGTLVKRLDASKAAAFGVRAELVASGARKGDGDPSQPLTDDERAALQRHIDDSAAVFFSEVAARRPISEQELRALEASVFVGAHALEVGLADRVGTLDELVASIASGTASASNVAAAAAPATKAGPTMDDKEKEARAALQAVIDGDGDDKAKARARAALSAMEESDERAEGDELDDDETKKKDEEARAAAAGGTVSARSAALALRASASAEERLARLEALHEKDQRVALYATRPNLPEATRAVLDKMPFADAKAMIESLPTPTRANPAAGAIVAGTPGEGAPTGGAHAIQPDDAMDIAMGLKKKNGGGIRTEEGRRLFGVMSPAQARAEIAAKANVVGGVK